MAKKLSSLDLGYFQLLKLRLQNLGTAPTGGGAVEGVLYHDTVSHRPFVHNGTAFAGLAFQSEVSGAYTDEMAQDAVGTILTDSSKIDFTYNDAANTITATIVAGSLATGDLANDAVTYAKLQNVSATSRVLGRITAAAGDVEELTGANVRTILGTLDADTLNGSSASALSTSIIASITASAPVALDTLNELAAALGNDANFATSTATALGLRVQRFSATIGDGTTTAIAVTHNLGTRDIVYSIRDATTHEFVDADALATSTNVLTITFGTAPATNSYIVVVMGRV